MRVAFFDTRSYDRAAFEEANVRFGHALVFLEPRLGPATAALASGEPAVCVFVNDHVGSAVLEALAPHGLRLVALRSAGFNNVDLAAAARLGVRVVRVPEYSPHAVAEFAIGLMLVLNRKIHRAVTRVREQNFALEGLVGFDMCGRTVGILGTGRIGSVTARILLGFGCRVLGYDRREEASLTALPGFRYASLEEVLHTSDILSLHLPLTPETHHLLDRRAFARMKPGVMVVNTGRGALVDSRALIDALKSGHVGSAGLDVYEEEEGVFFRDLSDKVLQDDVLARLLTFPNVVVTSHQAFLTREALAAIARTTLESLRAFERGERLENEVRAEDVIRG